MTPANEKAFAAALRAIKEALFALGADGDECIQKLVAAEALLGAEGRAGAQREMFCAFHLGLAGPAERAPDPHGNAGRETAFRVGREAARLNDQRRQESGLNIGPFDMPGVQEVLRYALEVAANP